MVLCIKRGLNMTALLWVAAAQPLVFAMILAIRGRRRSPKFIARHKSYVRPSLPCCLHGKTDQI